MSRPGEAPVSDEEWRAFVSAEVIPRLPDGFTVLAARGRWADERGARDEDSRVLLVVHPAGEAIDRSLDEIREAYRKRFHQRSVLRLDSPTRVRFR